MFKTENFKHDVRPWGEFHQYTHNEATTIKVITVEPGEKLSIQRHRLRDEVWVALDEGLLVTLNSGEKDEDSIRLMKPDLGQMVSIPRGWTHTIENIWNRPARFLEIAFGHFDEDDIERLEDKYGRT